MRRSAAVLILLVGLTGCSGNSSSATPSPTAVPTPPPTTQVPTATPMPVATHIAGWHVNADPDGRYTLALPLGWYQTIPTDTKELFAAGSPTEGTLFILLDDGTAAQEFNGWLAAHLAEETRISHSTATIEHVTIGGTSVIRDTTDVFGIGTAVSYYQPVAGKGVLELSFVSLEDVEPAIWSEIASTWTAG